LVFKKGTMILMKHFGYTFKLLLAGVFALLLPCAAVAQIDVLTQHQDPSRSGANLKETDLTIEKVNIKQKNQFGKLCFRLVEGNVYAQPLIVTGAKVAKGASPRDVVVVATEHNFVYAFDAADTDQNSNSAQLWLTDDTVFGKSVPSTTLSQDLGLGDGGCVDLTTEIGITSTPAILLTKATAPKEGVIFVVAKSLDAAHKYSFKLHALDLSDGTPMGSPVTIAAEVDGIGVGSTTAGKIVFTPMIQHQRPALLVDGTTLYVCFCGHCDTGPFHGWVFAYDISDPKTPKMLDVLCTTPNVKTKPGKDGEGGIWMSGQGPSSDGKGNIYLTTGNGSYDGKTDFGDSVLRFSLAAGKIKLADHFTPKNQEELKDEDADLGSAGVLLLPESNLLLGGGKEGRLYLIDRDAMGKQQQDFQVTQGPAKKSGAPDMRYWNIHGSPIAWHSKSGFFVYVCGEEDPVKVYRLDPAGSTGGWRFPFTSPNPNPPVAFSDESAPFPGFPRRPGETTRREDVWMPGGILALTANGDDPTTGILWAAMPLDDNANHRVVHGVLRAFDASNFAMRPGTGDGVPKQLVQIWSSDEKPSDSLGMFAKFNPPTVANGKVYVATFQEENPAPGAGFQVHTVKPGGLHSALAIYGLK
jgi:hypothetical protein